MWICIFGYVEMHFWLCKDTGTMNRSPTPDGMFCGASWVSVTLLTDRQQHYRNPSAAVGADLSRPHIRKHTRNGEGKCVFDNVKTRI